MNTVTSYSTRMLLPLDLSSRRVHTAPGTSLGDLAGALASELEPWCDTALPIPSQKARLTRVGGRCATDGTLLLFDPLRPHTHRCPRCGQEHTGREHDDWWAMGAQLFTVERAVHAAALYALRGDLRHRQLAARVLEELANRYEEWPDRDNVLGPSRPFFSTYLESIWLLNAAHAVSLLEATGAFRAGAVVRERLFEPSMARIASFPEQRSNRQVWNEVAILSVLHLLGRPAQLEQRLELPYGLPALLRDGLLADGTWYEGENYHQFAHRGLWYGVQLLHTIGHVIPSELTARFHEGFAAPFAGLLPDETFPARRDAPHAVSARQWRWAEWCELGYAFRLDGRLAGLLARLYDGSVTRVSDARARSLADAERNEPAQALSRRDLSWRALLMADPEPVPPGMWSAPSVVQRQQGLAVIRRERGQVYVALEGGVTGGGHGHPDRLALTMQAGAQRWCDDPGTGSYVERTLHWYRSTLAHHAPLVNGASQQLVPAQLMAYEDRGGAGWIRKQVHGIAPGVTATRTVVVCDGYLVDLLEWQAPHEITLTLPLCGDAGSHGLRWQSASRPGAGGLEDGFDFLTQVTTASGAPDVLLLHVPPTDATHRSLQGWVTTAAPRVWGRAVAPGAPAQPPAQRHWVEETGAAGRVLAVWSWSPAGETRVMASSVTFETGPVPRIMITTRDGTTATHEPAPHGWHIGLTVGPARSSIDLEGLCAGEPTEPPEEESDAPAPVPLHLAPLAAAHPAEVTSELVGSTRLVLAADQYRRTEEPYGPGNAPEVLLMAGATLTELVLRVHVRTGHAPIVQGTGPHQMPANPLDNERADVNADGLQCYVGGADRPGWHAGVLAVPLVTDATPAAPVARVTPLVPAGPVPRVQCAPLSDAQGWAMQLTWARADLPPQATLALLVNEQGPGRERRRGQLVLGGAPGFAYLKGDRYEPARAVPLVWPER